MSGEMKCKCGRSIHENFGDQRMYYGRYNHVDEDGQRDSKHYWHKAEPAEPSPVPPAQDDFEHDPDCSCSLDNVPHSKDCRNCECQPRKQCDLAPSGWQCTRLSGHSGPCAAELAPIPDDEKDYAELIAELVALREERDLLRAAIATPEVYVGVISEIVEKDFAFMLKTAREERDRLKSHYSDAKELIQRMMKEEEVLREERDRAQDALRAIESLCSDEITARFGGHAHKSEDELGRNSRVYALLVVPRNIARASLKPVSDRQPEGETK